MKSRKPLFATESEPLSHSSLLTHARNPEQQPQRVELPETVAFDMENLTSLPNDEFGVQLQVAAAISLIVSLFALLVLFWDTAVSMVLMWQSSGTFAHGFLIFPLSLYLIWQRREALSSLIPRPNLWGLLTLTGLTAGWLLGHLADVLVVQHFVFVTMLQVLVWTVLGSHITRTIVFPLLFLWFAVPVGEALIPPLQDFTARFAVTALELSGVPVFADGRIISVPSGNWVVAEACSGVRYIVATTALGCLFAQLTYRSWTRWFVFLGLSVIVPIIANGFRAYGIIMLGHLSNNRLAVGVDHIIYGGIFFVLVLFLLFAFGVWWQEPENTNSQPPSLVPHPSQFTPPNSISLPKRLLLTVLTAISSIIVVSLAPFAVGVLSSHSTAVHLKEVSAPSVSSPWTAESSAVGNWTPSFLGNDAEVKQNYRSGPYSVHLYIAYYANQHQGAEAVNSENRIANEKQWTRIAEGNNQATIKGEDFQVQETLFRSLQGYHLVWVWYWVNGKFTGNPYYAKLLQIQSRLLGRSNTAAAIVLATNYEGNPDEAATRLQEFLHHMGSLQETLRSFVAEERQPR